MNSRAMANWPASQRWNNDVPVRRFLPGNSGFLPALSHSEECRWQDDPAAPQKKGKNSHDHMGSVSLIDIPTADDLKKYTERVNANNRLGYSLAGMEKPRPDAKPVPVPERHGEPSVFEADPVRSWSRTTSRITLSA